MGDVKKKSITRWTRQSLMVGLFGIWCLTGVQQPKEANSQARQMPPSAITGFILGKNIYFKPSPNLHITLGQEHNSRILYDNCLQYPFIPQVQTSAIQNSIRILHASPGTRKFKIITIKLLRVLRNLQFKLQSCQHIYGKLGL